MTENRNWKNSFARGKWTLEDSSHKVISRRTQSPAEREKGKNYYLLFYVFNLRSLRLCEAINVCRPLRDIIFCNLKNQIDAEVNMIAV